MDFKGFLEKVIKEKDGVVGLEVTAVKESPCSKPGDNYMSVVSAADVQGLLSNGEPYSKHLFLKRPMKNAEYGELFRVKDAFQNEATMYLKMIPLYAAAVPCPRCYHADSDVIVLEDLRSAGYSMGERSKGFDLSTAVHIVKAIAKFHAASFHAKLTKRKEFSEVSSLLKLVGITISGNEKILEDVLSTIHTQSGAEPEFKAVLDFIKPLVGRVHKTLKTLRKAGKIEILCHGDFWINNILVRPGEDDPVRLVDLQASALTSPAVDVWSFLYTSLELPVMENHIEDLLQVYCNSFVGDLTSLKLPHEQTPSPADVMDDITSRELYGFLIANLYLPVLSLKPGSLPDIESVSKEDIMNKTLIKTMQFSGMEERFRTLVLVCKKRGIFDKELSLHGLTS